MNFHDPSMAAGGKALLLTGPFGDPERTIALLRPMAVAEIIAAHGLTFAVPTIAIIDGEPLLRGLWAVRIIRPGEVIAFVAVPRGGGGDGQGKQIIGLIAALALSIAAPMIGAALFGAGTLGASLISGAILIGGSMLLNALMPSPQSQSQESTAAGRIYSVSAASNQATPLEALPVLYGKLRFAPRHASRPYSEYEGNDQYLYQLFHVTTGKADIEKVEIGETEAWSASSGYSSSFSDIQLQIVQPGQAITLFPANVVSSSEVSGQTVPDPGAVLGPFVVNVAGSTIDVIGVDFAFPGGLWTANERAVVSNSIALRAQYQQIDNAGSPIGGWVNLFAETISAATRTPQRMSRRVSVAPARYRVRFMADEAFDADDALAVNRVAWTGLRGYLTDFVTPPNCTLLAVKIRANEQLSQFSSNQFRVTAERYLPVWTGDLWEEQKTRSIAWAAADLLMNSDYSVGLTTSQFDLSQLLVLSATWASRGDTFNAIFDRSWTVQDALRAILRAGRTQAVRMGGRIGFVRLEPKSIRRAVFSPRNVTRGSFSHKIVLFDEEKPDSVIGSFIDETIWQTREVRASLASVGSEVAQKLEWFGITNHDQAWRESITEAAVNAYNREFVSFTADWEGKLLVRGEPILIHHPFIEGVETVGLVSWAGLNITVDRAPASDIADDAYVIIRSKTGTEWGPCLVDSIVGKTIAFDAADFANVSAAMGALSGRLPNSRSERAHVLICSGEMRPFNGLVASATPQASGKVDIVAVIDSPEVYLADGTEVMPSPWTPPVLPPQNPARPLLLGLYAELRPGIAQLELDAMWQPSAGAIGGYVAEVSYDDDGLAEADKTWTPIYAGMANRFTVGVLPQKLVLRVAAIGVLQGPWTKRVFELGDVPLILIPDSNISLDLSNVAKDVLDQLGFKPRQLIESFKQLGTLLEEVDRENFTKRETLFREIAVELEGLDASFTEIIEVALGPGGAIALALESLYAAMGGNTAEVNVRWQAVAAPSGYSARYAIQAAVNDGSFRAATLFLDVPADPAQPTRVGILADQFSVLAADGTSANPLIFDAFGLRVNNALVKTASIDAAAITSAKIENAAITAAKINDLAVTSAKIGNLAVDTLKIADGAVTVSMAAANASTSVAYGTPRTAAITFGSFASGSILISGQVNIPEVGIPSGALMRLNLYRNGSLIRSSDVPWRWVPSTDDYFIGRGYLDLTYIDIPASPGSYAYVLELILMTSIGVAVPYNNMRVSGAYAKK